MSKHTEAYPGNHFANQLYHHAASVSFGHEHQLEPLVNDQQATRIFASAVATIDYRAKLFRENGYASVYEGLAFDPEVVRSQLFLLSEAANELPVAVLTVIIAPQAWIAKQRYFRRHPTGVELTDFSTNTSQPLPDFVIIPGWTKVAPLHLGRFAVPGFRAFQRVLKTVTAAAPANTWVESSTQGQWPAERRAELHLLSSQPLGSIFMPAELPFPPEMIGQPHPVSRASSKIAPILGLRRLPDIGSTMSLGPVFVRQVS